MARYFYDTEFLEGKQRVTQWGLKTDQWLWIFAGFIIISGIAAWQYHGFLFLLPFVLSAGLLISISFPSTPPTIDLISIGMVDESGREYYAISKDFNLKEAWNRYNEKINPDYKPSFGGGCDGHYNPQMIRTYWIRDNVLRPVFKQLWYDHCHMQNLHHCSNDFTYKNCKRLIDLYGLHNNEIAEDIVVFIYGPTDNLDGMSATTEAQRYEHNDKSKNPEFYGYYSAYDHVALCWLYGKMMDLPKGFPMFTIDLKQIMDSMFLLQAEKHIDETRLESWLKTVKAHPVYPRQTNEHNALEDAKWNKRLYEFLKAL